MFLLALGTHLADVYSHLPDVHLLHDQLVHSINARSRVAFSIATPIDFSSLNVTWLRLIDRAITNHTRPCRHHQHRTQLAQIDPLQLYQSFILLARLTLIANFEEPCSDPQLATSPESLLRCLAYFTLILPFPEHQAPTP